MFCLVIHQAFQHMVSTLPGWAIKGPILPLNLAFGHLPLEAPFYGDA